MAPILKCEKDDPRQELEFELDYQLSLTTAQRFRMMLRRSREMVPGCSATMAIARNLLLSNDQ